MKTSTHIEKPHKIRLTLVRGKSLPFLCHQKHIFFLFNRTKQFQLDNFLGESKAFRCCQNGTFTICIKIKTGGCCHCRLLSIDVCAIMNFLFTKWYSSSISDKNIVNGSCFFALIDLLHYYHS